MLGAHDIQKHDTLHIEKIIESSEQCCNLHLGITINKLL